MIRLTSGARTSALHFRGCSVFNTVDLPITITSIGSNAFDGCTSIKTINYAGSLQTKQWVGLNLSNISDEKWVFSVTETLNLPQGLIQLNANALRGTSAEQIIVPAEVEEIQNNAFADCSEFRLLLVMGVDTVIADNALFNSPNVKVFCPTGSAVHTWCLNNNIACTAF